MLRSLQAGRVLLGADGAVPLLDGEVQPGGAGQLHLRVERALPLRLHQVAAREVGEEPGRVQALQLPREDDPGGGRVQTRRLLHPQAQDAAGRGRGELGRGLLGGELQQQEQRQDAAAAGGEEDGEVAQGAAAEGAGVQGLRVSIAGDDCFVYFAMLVMIYCSYIDDIQSGHSKETLGTWKCTLLQN